MFYLFSVGLLVFAYLFVFGVVVCCTCVLLLIVRYFGLGYSCCFGCFVFGVVFAVACFIVVLDVLWCDF